MKTKVKVILIAIASLLGGILYRLGGIGKPFNTKVRDLGVPIVALGLLALIGGRAPWWAWLGTFGCMFGTMTTYFKFKGDENVKWYSWLIVGFVFGLSALLYAIGSGHWVGMIIRTIILSVSVMWWSEYQDNAKWEEFGRGYLFVTTIPLLLI